MLDELRFRGGDRLFEGSPDLLDLPFLHTPPLVQRLGGATVLATLGQLQEPPVEVDSAPSPGPTSISSKMPTIISSVDWKPKPTSRVGSGLSGFSTELS